MGLVQRKARPLQRDKQDFRDDRLFIIACDDTYAPKQYFDFFKLPRIHVHVVSTTDGTSHASEALLRLKEYEYRDEDQRWLLLDTDHCVKDAHQKNFSAALQQAKQAGIEVALSRPCFELWLLLHHAEVAEIISLKNAREVEAALATKLGSYDKTCLKKEDFLLSTVVRAINACRQLDESVFGGDIPTANTSRVYRLWLALIEHALPSQLPEVLHTLKV
jgi:hypothetical protein